MFPEIKSPEELYQVLREYRLLIKAGKLEITKQSHGFDEIIDVSPFPSDSLKWEFRCTQTNFLFSLYMNTWNGRVVWTKLEDNPEY